MQTIQKQAAQLTKVDPELAKAVLTGIEQAYRAGHQDGIDGIPVEDGLADLDLTEE